MRSLRRTLKSRRRQRGGEADVEANSNAPPQVEDMANSSNSLFGGKRRKSRSARRTARRSRKVVGGKRRRSRSSRRRSRKSRGGKRRRSSKSRGGKRRRR